MSKLLTFLAVLSISIGVMGCADLWPIGQVMATRVVDSLVQQIGEAEVQRQKVINAIDEAKAEITRLQRVEAESSVKAEMLSEKLEELKAKKEELRESMLRLADLIEAGQPVTLTNGTVLTIPDLIKHAERAKSQFEALNQKIAIYQKSVDLLMSTAQEAHTRWIEGKDAIAELEAQLELLDAQIATLKLFQEQPAISRATTAYRDAIAEAQRIMNETLEKLEQKRRIFEKMRELQALESEPIQSQAELLELDLRSSEDLVAELRALAEQ
ncbi:MAG: hypothetical protein RML36_14470 [Anaerolineae bacterium]|nr:hypothetical protein [Anaerolineae bacterium]MDW8100674.1 hypothetical protein [Anaerolineae bacterium]